MKKLAEFFNRILNNNVVFIIMITIYPVSFFMSANPTTYYPVQYLIAILILLCVALLVSGLIELVFFIFKTSSFFSSRTKRVVYLIAAFPIVLEPMRRVTILLIPYSGILIYNVIAFLLIIMLLGRKWAKEINILIMALLSTCLVMYFWAIFEGEMRDRIFMNISGVAPEIEGVQFISRPNVYYFYLESYHGREAMTELFNYDNAELYDYLQMNNFKVYNNTYSNYNNTYHSLINTFLMKHNYYYFGRGLRESEISGKEIIAGNKNNNLLNAFRNNGYDINYFLLSEWINPYQTKATNVYFSHYSVLNFLYDKSFSLLRQIWAAYKDNPKNDTPDSRAYYKNKSSNYLDDMLAMIKETNINYAPQFFFIESGVFHVPADFRALPPEIRNTTSRNEYEDSPYKFLDYFTEEYVEKKIKPFNITFMELLGRIIREDPGAVIVLLGDHGSHKYFNIDRKGIDNMLLIMRDAGITNRDYANSMFNVLLAIRMPPDLVLPETDVISNVNVFRYVLSALSGTTNLIENKEDDISLTFHVISVKDGKPLEYPEPIEIEELQRQKLGIK